jgi:hypothetical protein
MTSINNRVTEIKQENYEKKIDNLLIEYGITNEQFAYYKEKNNQETRLIEYKDDDHILIAKIILLNYINESREKYKSSIIELDILASRVANKMSVEAAENNFMGHWNLRGEKPYHRYSLAGGVDHIAENAAAAWSSEKILTNIDNAIKLMKDAHDNFMSGTPPNDGHKRNVIQKYHNSVGLGYAFHSKNFRYYEEYLDRYLEIETGKIRVKVGNDNNLRLKTIDPEQHVYAIIVYKESPLENMTVEEINSKSSYGDYSSNTVIEIWPWELPEEDSEGFISINLKFTIPGSFYVQCYIDDKTISKRRNADTRDKIQASGVVYYVH